jgi:hypothetical protein
MIGQLDLIRDTALRSDPRLAPPAAPPLALNTSRFRTSRDVWQANCQRAFAASRDDDTLASATFCGFLAVVCHRRGLDFGAVMQQLARSGTLTLDTEWCAASQAREIAIYLASVICNLRNASLHRALGLSRPAVTLALRRVEDRRDDPEFDAEIRALVMIMTGKDEGQ